MGKTADEVLREALHRVVLEKHGNSIERTVSNYASLSIVAGAKTSVMGKEDHSSKSPQPNNKIYNGQLMP